MAKSCWEIENQGFNDAKNRYGFEHICHHEQRSLLMVWLLTCLALTIERLYQVRYLHRGTHPILEAIALCQLLWLSLSRPVPDDTSLRFSPLRFGPPQPGEHSRSRGEVLLKIQQSFDRRSSSVRNLSVVLPLPANIPKLLENPTGRCTRRRSGVCLRSS